MSSPGLFMEENEMHVNFDELNFDATDADTLKKYLDATKAVSKRASMADAGQETPEQFRILCESVKTCFDDIFGAGTGENICGVNNSLKVCSNAFRELVEEYNRQMKEQDRANKALAAAMDATNFKGTDIVSVNGQGKVVDVE